MPQGATVLDFLKVQYYRHRRLHSQSRADMINKQFSSKLTGVHISSLQPNRMTTYSHPTLPARRCGVYTVASNWIYFTDVRHNTDALLLSSSYFFFSLFFCFSFPFSPLPLPASLSHPLPPFHLPPLSSSSSLLRPSN